MSLELPDFLAARPQLRFIDLLLNDLNGVDRGKRVYLACSRAVCQNGWRLPGSMFELDVLGHSV